MKKNRILLSAGVTLLVAGASQAAVVVTEEFSYSDGVLGGQAGGTGFGGAWSVSSSVNTPPNQFVLTSGEAIFTGNGSNQEIITHSRQLGSSYALNSTTTIAIRFDLIVNETQLGRGIGVNLVDTVGGSRVFIGKQINQGGSANGVHASLGAAGVDYAILTGSGSGPATLTATLTSDGTDTFVSLTNGTETVTGTIAGTQFTFDAIELTGYHNLTSSNGVDNLSLDVAAVPEPGVFALVGLAGLGLLRRRR